ncbi:UNVERIFIED_CONTAM: hypothetical protein FKN15_011848 [Acipenser sinensis]
MSCAAQQRDAHKLLVTKATNHAEVPLELLWSSNVSLFCSIQSPAQLQRRSKRSVITQLGLRFHEKVWPQRHCCTATLSHQRLSDHGYHGNASSSDYWEWSSIVSLFCSIQSLAQLQRRSKRSVILSLLCVFIRKTVPTSMLHCNSFTPAPHRPWLPRQRLIE